MEFTKWSSIENHYNTVKINKWFYKNPELNDEKFLITEKIHGANFSIIAQDGQIAFAKRTGIIKPDEDFYGYKEVFSRSPYIELVEYMKELSLQNVHEQFQLYGELYGGKIQKGVDYGPEKNFRWYAMAINGNTLAPLYQTTFSKIKDLFVPVIAMPTIGPDLGMDFFEYLEKFDTKFDSKLTPDDHEGENICEGVVIRPFRRNYFLNGQLLQIKKKNDKFIDRQHQKKVPRPPKEVSENVQKWIDKLSTFVNSVRTDDLMSKMGPLEDIHNIGGYAKSYFSDIYSELGTKSLREWEMLEKSDTKIVKKTLSGLIFAELKRFLQEG